MNGNVQVDEFVVGGKETGKPSRSYDSRKKKVVCAVQLTDEGKVRRFYSLKIKDFSSESLVGIFEKHISAEVKEMGVKVEETFLRVTELEDSLRGGTLQETFGTRTTASIALISKIHINGRD